MSLSSGPNLGLLVNGALGDQHYSELMRFLRGVDLLVQPSVLSATLATPPSTPADGDAYIVAASPTGAWTGYTNAIARWSAVLGAWEFLAPKKGWFIFNASSNINYQYNGSAWSIIVAPIASPVFTGIPQAPTAPSGTNTNQLATTAFVLANSIMSGIKKVAEVPVGAATSSVSFNSLDLDAAKFYIIIASFINPDAVNQAFYRAHINGDATETNYYNQRIDGSGSTVSTTELNDSSFAYAGINSSSIYFGIMMRASGLIPMIMGMCPDPISGGIVARAGWHWKYTAAGNVNSIDFVSSNANGIGAGSYISLYSN